MLFHGPDSNDNHARLSALGRCLFALFLTLVVSGCVGSSSPNIIGVVDTKPSATREPSITQHIFFATNRALSDDPAAFFSGERAQMLSLGEVDVTIPPTHEIGQIEKPKNGKPDPSKHFVVKTPTLYENTGRFERDLTAELKKRPPGKRDVLLFVHGYNVNFSAAVLRVAQFANDADFEGVAVLFSWPSRGKTLDYVYDINSALGARESMEELAVILGRVPAENYDIVAHSMGTLLTMETLVRIRQQRLDRNYGRLRQVILASPDIDFDLFGEQLSEFDDVKERFYVLVSDDDKALGFSRRIAGGVSRAGASDPEKLSALGVNVIDLSQVDDESTGHHTKFASAPGVVQLIGRGMQDSGSLSAQSEANVLDEITTEMVRGVTFIPSVLLTGRPPTIGGVGGQGPASVSPP